MPFTRAQLQPFIDERWINAQRHPELPLTIYNYTQRTQFAKHWTPETIACRGLVLDDDDRVVMRPFPKFFNQGEHDTETMPTGQYSVYEKYDGSLFIVGNYKGVTVTATRGSFTSPQADLGRELLRKVHPGFLPDTGLHTFCFELIHPNNRIVVDYGMRSELVLLAIIDNQSGRSWPLPDEYACPVSHPIPRSMVDAILADPTQQANREGFVLHFHESNTRVKVKFDEYVRLHKLVTGINARHIWERLSTGQAMDEVLERVPDEFYEWVRATERDLRDRFKIARDYQFKLYSTICHDCGYGADRKIFAQSVQRMADDGVAINRPVMFALYDGRSIDALIWKDLRPEATTPFRKDEAA